MSEDNAYDPTRKYDDDETFTLTGKTVNSISNRILVLRQKLKDIEDEQLKEELKMLRIRDKNPAVKDAWDQYQTVLGLAKRD